MNDQLAENTLQSDENFSINDDELVHYLCNSALDAESERQVQDALDRIIRGLYISSSSLIMYCTCMLSITGTYHYHNQSIILLYS